MGEKNPNQQLLCPICTAVSGVVMFQRAGRVSPRPPVPGGRTRSLAHLLRHRCVADEPPARPSCLPPPHWAGGGANGSRFCNFPPIWPVEKWQPARCAPAPRPGSSTSVLLRAGSERCRLLSRFEKPVSRATLLCRARQQRVGWPTRQGGLGGQVVTCLPCPV